MLDIQKREGSGDSKSETPIKMEAVCKRNNKKDSRRLSYGSQKETKLDLDGTSECLATDRIIEGMNIACENGDFDLTKMG
jgi:hypothetical protein